ncbi:MAG: C-GCAxxG-C-C family protein [Bacteroidales bacterium]
MTNSEKAKDIFDSGLNCAQSVLLVFAKRFNLDKDLTIKLASGFGGGMARMQETCGAVTGSIIAIGLAAYNPSEDFPTSKERVYYIISKFIKRFKEKYDSTLCHEILNCDLNTEEGNRFYEDTGMREKICAGCVIHAVDILDDLIGK